MKAYLNSIAEAGWVLGKHKVAVGAPIGLFSGHYKLKRALRETVRATSCPFGLAIAYKQHLQQAMSSPTYKLEPLFSPSETGWGQGGVEKQEKDSPA